MQRKKVIAIMLLAIMLVSLAGNALASDWENEWRELREYLGEKQSPLEKSSEVESFRKTYWQHLFPEVSEEPKFIPFNPDGLKDYEVLYYGKPEDIPQSEGQVKDGKGAWVYLGYTRDNRYVSNITFAAQSWKNPQMLDRDYHITGKGKGKFTGLIHPFTTDYNDPRFVGEAYLGKNTLDGEKEAYGRQILNTWAKNVMNRNIGWQDGKNFYSIFNNDLDRFLKHVTITVPPTSRSYGQCLVWFKEASGRMTHRTFYIAPTEPIDFIAKRYTWDEPTKTLTVFYEKKGLEKVEGILYSALLGKSYFSEETINHETPALEHYKMNLGDEVYYSPVYNMGEKPGGNKEIALLGRDVEDESAWSLIMHLTYDEVKEGSGMMGKEQTVKFRLPYLNDQRAEDITLTAIVNANHAFPEYHDNAYANNEIDVVIPATIKPPAPEPPKPTPEPPKPEPPKVEEKVDLSIEFMQTIDMLEVGKSDIAIARVKNTASTPITTDLAWRLGGKEIRKVSITIPAKGYKEDSCKVTMPKVKDSITLEAEVNPSRNKPAKEVRWDNNKDKFVTYKEDEREQAGAGDPYLVK